jgi:hypothetical protein
MRVASFALPGKTEVSVVALPGDAGGDLANVNRWRGQLGLPAVNEAEFAAQSKRVASPAGELLLIAFDSPSKGSMMGARLLAGGQTWFFKMTGPKDGVAANRNDFSRFLANLRPASGGVQQEMPAPPQMASSEESAAGKVSWKLPSGWREETGSGMRVATLRAPSDAEVSVIALPGDAGGDLANVNRWRGQLELPPLAESELAAQAKKVAAPAGEVLVVDFAAPSKGRMVGARLFAGGQSWFFKLTGKDGAVASAKPAFNNLLGSLRLETR